MAPKLLVFASGSKNGGGSGFRKLVEESRSSCGKLNADIVGVVSNYGNGGVKQIAEEHKIPFYLLAESFTAERYKCLVRDTGAEWVALSGWLKLVKGLDPQKTINIHPGPLPDFGGNGMYGHHVHTTVLKAFKAGKITHSAVTMHFVDAEYDRGPIFFSVPVEIKENDTPETLGKRVNGKEHEYQSLITSMVVNGRIKWDGEQITLPEWYKKIVSCPKELE